MAYCNITGIHYGESYIISSFQQLQDKLFFSSELGYWNDSYAIRYDFGDTIAAYSDLSLYPIQIYKYKLYGMALSANVSFNPTSEAQVNLYDISAEYIINGDLCSYESTSYRDVSSDADIWLNAYVARIPQTDAVQRRLTAVGFDHFEISTPGGVLTTDFGQDMYNLKLTSDTRVSAIFSRQYKQSLTSLGYSSSNWTPLYPALSNSQSVRYNADTGLSMRCPIEINSPPSNSILGSPLDVALSGRKTSSSGWISVLVYEDYFSNINYRLPDIFTYIYKKTDGSFTDSWNTLGNTYQLSTLSELRNRHVAVTYLSSTDYVRNNGGNSLWLSDALSVKLESGTTNHYYAVATLGCSNDSNLISDTLSINIDLEVTVT